MYLNIEVVAPEGSTILRFSSAFEMKRDHQRGGGVGANGGKRQSHLALKDSSIFSPLQR